MRAAARAALLFIASQILEAHRRGTKGVTFVLKAIAGLLAAIVFLR